MHGRTMNDLLLCEKAMAERNHLHMDNAKPCPSTKEGV